MPAYNYTAKDENGNLFSRTCDDVQSIAALRQELAKMGDTLVRAARLKSTRRKKTKIKQSEVVTFAYKFAGMCSAGLSITRCLETFEEQTDNNDFKHILTDVRESIETGSTLKNAFEKHKETFSDFFIGMVEAGETGGRLAEALNMSAVYQEGQVDLKRRVQSAFAYPIVVGCICLVIVSALVIFIVPTFSKLYRQLHVSLPLPTQILVSLSEAIEHWWWVIILGVAGSAFLLKRLKKDPWFRAKWDLFKLNMPVFAKLNRLVVVSRFIRTFAMLISTGVPFVKALDVASVVTHNSKVSEIAAELQRSIEAGNPVAGSMRNYDLFPPIIVQLAAAGENAGVLPEMLNKGVDFLDKDIQRIINALLVKLEPAMTLIMGILVGSILMAVYLPMFDYLSHLK